VSSPPAEKSTLIKFSPFRVFKTFGFNYFQNVIERFFPKTNVKDDNVRKVEIKLEATPSLDQIKELMAYSSGFSEGSWADVIFVDEFENNTSIKTHRIVERVTLPPTAESYSCDQLYKVVSESRDNYLPLAGQQDNIAELDIQAIGTAQ